jgi:hypothetical protein
MSSNPLTNLYTDEKFKREVRELPWEALAYPHRLTDEQFAYCIAEYPHLALAYPSACLKLDDSQFNYCIAECPKEALAYKHACARLSQNAVHFDNCFKAHLHLTFRYQHIYVCLNPYQRSWLKKVTS